MKKESTTNPPPPGAAARRAAHSFFRESSWGAATLVCHGTSCHLRGDGSFGSKIAGSGRRAQVHCLGYCDRSPAALLPDGRVALRGDLIRGPREAGLPAVRSLVSEPLVTARVIRGDHSEFEVARAAGVWSSWLRALPEGPEAILDELERSGERGRGGAGFPTGAKWRACAAAPGARKVVIANGDEGDPGSFVDRVLMQYDPHAVLEGLALCGLAVGAAEGVVYVRGEYPASEWAMGRAVEEARAAGMLGPSVAGTGVSFDVRIEQGRGSYVCGEETALLNAIEGHRGEVRLRPPYPVEHGLDGAPTVINNVETLVNVPEIVSRGAAAYRRLGTEASPGTKAMCLNAGFASPGLVEVAFGTSLAELIEGAGGAASGTTLDAVLLGGPMGSVVAPDEWDAPICYDAMSRRGIQLGHGGLVALPKSTNWRALVLHLLDFARAESCGRCAPCRLGSERAYSLAQDQGDGDTRAQLEAVFDAMERGSLCAFGQLIPGPVRALIARHGGEIFAP